MARRRLCICKTLLAVPMILLAPSVPTGQILPAHVPPVEDLSVARIHPHRRPRADELSPLRSNKSARPPIGICALDLFPGGRNRAVFVGHKRFWPDQPPAAGAPLRST